MESASAAGWREWLLLLVRPDEPGFWLLVDILAGLAFALLLRGAVPGRRNLVRALRWLVTPFMALLFGAVALETMGVVGIDWALTLRLGLPLVAGMLLLLGLVRLAVRPEPLGRPGAVPASGETPFAILYAGVEQVHWCFQRAALLTLFMALPVALQQPAYWAMWAAVLLALPGLFLLPGGWARIWTSIALATTAILFFYTRNFWLAWALHAGIMMMAGPAIVHSRASTPVHGAGPASIVRLP